MNMNTGYLFSPNSSSRMQTCYLLMGIFFGVIASGCRDESKDISNPIPIGALLPFSGEQAAVGLNIEQALSLAIADINDAGGVDGRPLMLISRDSNSGSEQGYQQAMQLLYEYNVKYLIGPEENELARRLIPHVKELDVLHIIPAIAAPTIRQTGDEGAWIRLAPPPSSLGCAMAHKVLSSGHKTAATIMLNDDYQKALATAFNSFFADAGGELVGSISVQPGKFSYLKELETLEGLGADATVMMAYPATGAAITQDWTISGNKGDWYLGPTLYTDVFLQNVPFGALEGFHVFSPSLSLPSECVITDVGDPSYLTCMRGNVAEFAAHYSNMWGQDHPLPASRFYYDSVVLLALGLQRSFSLGEISATPKTISDYIRYVSEKPGVTVRWNNIGAGLAKIANLQDVAYSGAAAEYEYKTSSTDDYYGEANQKIIDVWSIQKNAFTISDTIGAYCTRWTVY